MSAIGAVVGIVANPASGKDVRRLVARASVFDNQEKQAIVSRALIGMQASAGDALQVRYLDDAHGIVRGALENHTGEICAEPVAATENGNALDTISAARALRDAQCAVVLTLGGDGTNRAFALGWPDAPLIPISTGTNNVFPNLLEATVAGAAAGLVASGNVALRDVAQQQKLIRADIEGERPDIALIDAVLSRERFVGARALLSPEHLELVLLTQADPAAVGMTTLGGLIQPLDTAADQALLIEIGSPGTLLSAPIAPGHYRTLELRSHHDIGFNEPVSLTGPGILAFDGERERRLLPGQQATLTVDRSGPWVVDVRQTLHQAALSGSFIQPITQERHHAH